MRWSCVAFAVTLAVSSVYSIPLHATRDIGVDLARRTNPDDTKLPYDSSAARQKAADNVGQSEVQAGHDAGHILPKEAFGQILDKNKVDASKLSSETKHLHEKQTVPEPSGQNRGAGNAEAKNVAEILSGGSASHPISSGHRDMQTDPANQALAKETVKEFKDKVKEETGVNMKDAVKDAQNILDNQPCKRDLVDENGMLNIRDLYDENGFLDRRTVACALPDKKKTQAATGGAQKMTYADALKTGLGKTQQPAVQKTEAKPAAPKVEAKPVVAAAKKEAKPVVNAAPKVQAGKGKGVTGKK